MDMDSVGSVYDVTEVVEDTLVNDIITDPDDMVSANDEVV